MIDSEALAELRAVAEGVIATNMKTEITVMRRSRAAENPYGTSGETWTADETYLGWVKEISATDLQASNRLAGQVGEYEVRLPIEAVVSPGDRLVIGGDQYVVQNTNNLDTLPIFMKATIRRIE